MADETEAAPQQRWAIDKRIPLALIMTLVIQTGGALVWAATVTERINALERIQLDQKSFGDRIIRLEVTTETVKETTKDTREALGRVEGKLDAIRQQQQRNTEKIDALQSRK